MTTYSLKMVTRLPMVREATGPKVRTPEEVAMLCRDLECLGQEVFQVWTLNQKNVLLERYTVSLGSVTGTLVHPREVFRPAIHDGAAAIVLVHNHPSGDPEPSRDDRELTVRLLEAAKLLGIRVLDHVVIGKAGFFSFEDQGILNP